MLALSLAQRDLEPTVQAADERDDPADHRRAAEVLFLYLGSLGFGGPVALVGYMQRDLVERRGWFTKEEYMKSPGALPARARGPWPPSSRSAWATSTRACAGATLVALAFILPSFVMTVAIGWLYVRFGGLSWMQAAFYGVGATVIGIIADRRLQARQADDGARTACSG